MTSVEAPAGIPVVRPADLAEAAEAVRDAGRMLFRGGATKLAWGAPPQSIQTVVDTRDLTRVVRHDAQDGVAVVEAGVGLDQLAELVAGHGQQLAVDDPAIAAGATVGGVIAAAADGPRRLRFGPVRGLVLGATVVLADGTVARSGGTVIKNVAGYDLMRLMTGSLGTLGLIAEVALRLHPLPVAAATVSAAGDADAAARAVGDLLASPLEPAALTWRDGRDGEDAELLVGFEGHAEAVEQQCAAAGVRLSAAGMGTAEPVDEAVWSDVKAGMRANDGETVARAVTLPSELPGLAADLAAAAASTGTDATLISQAGIGLHDAVLRGPATSQAACVRQWRERVTARGGTVVARDRAGGVADPDGVWDPHTVWGPPPPGFEPMRRIKQALDPLGRCAPGRHVGGL